MMSFTFPKKEKLKSKKRIERLFKEGESISNYPIKLIYLKAPLPGDLKIQSGMAVPKKKFRSAVERNKIKRLLRESYRLNKPLIFNNIEGDFAFLFLYIGKEIQSYKDIEMSMAALLKKFIKQTSHENSD